MPGNHCDGTTCCPQKDHLAVNDEWDKVNLACDKQ